MYVRCLSRSLTLANNPYENGSHGSDPFDSKIAAPANLCPICKSDNYSSHRNQYETWRDCNKCGNRWSGGSMGAARRDYSGPPPSPPGMPDYEDPPETQSTGAAFRNPLKNRGIDDE